MVFWRRRSTRVASLNLSRHSTEGSGLWGTLQLGSHNRALCQLRTTGEQIKWLVSNVGVPVRLYVQEGACFTLQAVPCREIFAGRFSVTPQVRRALPK
jgi:hypothetical protein